jgi:hypothetical protein
MKYFFTTQPCDVVIDRDDQVWISIKPPIAYNYGHDFEREEVIRAKGFDPARATYEPVFGRSRKSGSGLFDRHTGRTCGDDEGIHRARDVDPLDSWAEAWNKHWDQYQGRSGRFRPRF